MLCILEGYCLFIERHLHQRCCTYVPSTNVSNYVHDFYDNVARLKLETAGATLREWLSGLGGSMFSEIVEIALPFVLPIIMLYVVVNFALCLFHRMTAPPINPPRVLPRSCWPPSGWPTRVAQSVARSGAQNVATFLRLSLPLGPFILFRLTTLLRERWELLKKGGPSLPSRGRCLDSRFPLFFLFFICFGLIMSSDFTEFVIF